MLTLVDEHDEKEGFSSLEETWREVEDKADEYGVADKDEREACEL